MLFTPSLKETPVLIMPISPAEQRGRTRWMEMADIFSVVSIQRLLYTV
ncbi:MAG: hypothetical protein ABI856_17380 [Nitrospira sp.]